MEMALKDWDGEALCLLGLCWSVSSVCPSKPTTLKDVERDCGRKLKGVATEDLLTSCQLISHILLTRYLSLFPIYRWVNWDEGSSMGWGGETWEVARVDIQISYWGARRPIFFCDILMPLDKRKCLWYQPGDEENIVDRHHFWWDEMSCQWVMITCWVTASKFVCIDYILATEHSTWLPKIN